MCKVDLYPGTYEQAVVKAAGQADCGFRFAGEATRVHEGGIASIGGTQPLFTLRPGVRLLPGLNCRGTISGVERTLIAR